MKIAGRLCELISLLSGNLWFKCTWLLIPPSPAQPQLDSFYGYCALIVISLEAGGCCPCDWNVMCPADQWTLVCCCSWCSAYCISNCTDAVCRREPSRRNYRGEKSQEGGGAVGKKGRIEKGTETEEDMWGARGRNERWSVRGFRERKTERHQNTVKERTATNTDCRLRLCWNSCTWKKNKKTVSTTRWQ